MPKKVTKTESTTDFSSIIDRIKPASEHQTQVSALVYGRSGTGKTAFAGTWPKPAIILDIREKGTETVANVDGLEVIRIDRWEEFEQFYWYLKSQKTKYKSIIVDQISNLQMIAMEKVRRDNNFNEHDTFSKRDWGSVSGMLQTWLFNYRDLVEHGFHVLFIAHEKTIASDEQTEEQIDPNIGARLMPSVVGAINGAVSVIGNTFVREQFVGDDQTRLVQYCMRLGPHAYYTTKIRQPMDSETVDVMVNPSFDKILSIMKGEGRKKAKLVKKEK